MNTLLFNHTGSQ